MRPVNACVIDLSILATYQKAVYRKLEGLTGLYFALLVSRRCRVALSLKGSLYDIPLSLLWLFDLIGRFAFRGGLNYLFQKLRL